MSCGRCSQCYQDMWSPPLPWLWFHLWFLVGSFSCFIKITFVFFVVIWKPICSAVLQSLSSANSRSSRHDVKHRWMPILAFTMVHCKNKLVIATENISENGCVPGTHPVLLFLPRNLFYPVPEKFTVMSDCCLKYFVPVITFSRFVQMLQPLILRTINPKFGLL